MSDPPDEDDFTHYFNATARLTQENKALRARLAQAEQERDKYAESYREADDRAYKAERRLARAEETIDASGTPGFWAALAAFRGGEPKEEKAE